MLKAKNPHILPILFSGPKPFNLHNKKENSILSNCACVSSKGSFFATGNGSFMYVATRNGRISPWIEIAGSSKAFGDQMGPRV